MPNEFTNGLPNGASPDRNKDSGRIWDSPQVTEYIIKKGQGAVPGNLIEPCLSRLGNFRDELRDAHVGFESPSTGWLVYWLIATLIARENALLIGEPGTAKSELATRAYTLLQLEKPTGLPELTKDAEEEQAVLAEILPEASSPKAWWEWWKRREKLERKTQKYFHYMLSQFTQPEELFGPVEISLLRLGILARVNFGLMSGPGVRAAFIDEVFKGSSSILNTMLGLMSERTYFNWGGQVESDLLMFIGASNELPGGFATGTAGIGAFGADFQTLYAFLDRFAVRLHVPLVSADKPAEGVHPPGIGASNLAMAFDKAVGREGNRFCYGELFRKPETDMPCINDLLLLGRYCYQYLARVGESAFDEQELADFRNAFLCIASDLRQDPTSAAQRRVSWTISPRKLKALYKIALAHAMVRSAGQKRPHLGEADLQVFALIWDTLLERAALEDRVNALIARCWKPKKPDTKEGS